MSWIVSLDMLLSDLLSGAKIYLNNVLVSVAADSLY